MNTGLEGLTVSAWVVGTLTQDATLRAALGVTTAAQAATRVVEGVLPADTAERLPNGAPWPWVTFTVVEPQDVSVVGLVQVMALVEVQVKVTTPGESYAPAAAVYQRAHQLLHGARNVPAGGGTILTAERVSAIQFPEKANGIHYRNVGGLYRTHTQ